MNKLWGCGSILIFIIIMLFVMGSDSPELWWVIIIVSVVVLLLCFIPLFSKDDSPDAKSIKSDSSMSQSNYPTSNHSSSATRSYVPPSYCPPTPIGVPYNDDYYDEDGFASVGSSSTSFSSQSLPASQRNAHEYNSLENDNTYPTNLEDILVMADTIFQYSQHLEKDVAFREELAKHNIEFNDENGEPLLGYGADVRRLFFIDIAHCYAEMNNQIDLGNSDGTGVLYLLCILYNPDLGLSDSKDYIDLFCENMTSIMTRFVQAIAEAPIFQEDDEADFMVALLLLQYDHDEFQHYLMLLYRFCSLVAKADGHISAKEMAFLDHLTQLRTNTVSNCGNLQTVSDTDKRYGLEDLNSLIGLNSVKREVQTMYNFVKIQLSRRQQGLKTTPVSYHCVFTGNPGTGKTTVARILAGIYADLGVLQKGHLVETDRSGLVAEYEGQTAVKTNKVIDRALGGVLFIDEAYSLVTGDQTDFGREAIATLLKRMEDDRDKLVVILAGYGEEMKQFIDSNPGLQSRFNRYIHFQDYSVDELVRIFNTLVEKYDYELTEEARLAIYRYLKESVDHKDKNFGNGRAVRNLFEKTLERQANRLVNNSKPTLKQLKEITIEDCP